MTVSKSETPTLTTLTFQSYLSFAARYTAYKLKGGKKYLHQLIHEDIYLELAQNDPPFLLEDVTLPAEDNDEDGRPISSKKQRRKALKELKDVEMREAISVVIKPRSKYALAAAFAKHARSRSPRDVTKFIQSFKMVSEIIEPDEVGKDVVKQQFINGLTDETFREQIDAMTQAMTLEETYKTTLEHSHIVEDAIETAKPYHKRARTTPLPTTSTRSPQGITRPPTFEHKTETQPKRQDVKCSYCYKDGHAERECFAKKKGISKCNHGLRLGHDEPVCRAKAAGKPKVEHAKLMMNISRSDDVLSGTASIHGNDITVLFDTGASDNFIAKKWASEVSHSKKNVTLANESKLETDGQTSVTVTVNPNKVVARLLTLDITAHVVENLPFGVIIGYPTMLSTGLITSITPVPDKSSEFIDEEETLLNTITNTLPMTVQDRFETQYDVFGPLANTPSLLVPYTLKLKPDAKMVSRPPYKVPDWKREQINEHLDSLLETGVIEKSQSPWGSPVVIVPKKNGRTRMCVDYSRINDQTDHFEYPLPRIEQMIDTLSANHWYTTIDLSSGYH